MIKDIINKLENENGELELLYSRPYENDYGYVEFSLKTNDYTDIMLRIENKEIELLKFLLMYKIINNYDVELAERMSNLIIFESENIVDLVFKLKKNRVDLNKSIEDIITFRTEDLVDNLAASLNVLVKPIDTYSLINITVGELDNILSEDFNVELFKKGRYKIFLYLANDLIESKEDKGYLMPEERAIIKSTILSLALRKKENIYYITKEIIREMTGYIKDKIELNSEKILEVVKEHKCYTGYEIISGYDSNTLIVEENKNFYEKIDILLFIIPFLYCEIESNEDEIEYLELETDEDEDSEEEFDLIEDIERENDELEITEVNEDIIIKEVEKFKKIIPSAKEMAERYYKRRKEIIDSQFKYILELFNKADLIRSVELDFTLIDEVRDYLLNQGYGLEENHDENKTVIMW